MTREGTAAPAQSPARQITPLTVTAESAQLGATSAPTSAATSERRVVVGARQPSFEETKERHAQQRRRGHASVREPRQHEMNVRIRGR